MSIARTRARHLFFSGGTTRMKQALRRELTNIVFLILIVAAALVIFLLSRTGGESPVPKVAQTATATDTPAPAEATATQPASRGVPESVFQTFLATSDVFSAKQDRRDARVYVLTYGKSPSIAAHLRYEVLGGSVSSVELTCPLPVKYKDKGKTSIEAYLYETSQEQERALSGAVRVLLSEVLPASCADDALQRSTVRYWAEQAMLLAKIGDDFEDTLHGYRFLAYRKQGEDAQELVCVLYLA